MFRIVRWGALFWSTATAAQAVTAMLSGNVAFAAAGAPEVITTNAEGRHVRALARLYSGLSGSVVLSKETAGHQGGHGARSEGPDRAGRVQPDGSGREVVTGSAS